MLHRKCSIEANGVATKIAANRQDCVCQDAESELNHIFLMELDSCIASPFIPEGVLRQEYLENGLSLREIVREFACSKTYIRGMLLRYKIPLRKTSDYRGSRWFVYGKRRVGGKTVDHKGEQRAIATIKQMYGEGVSTSAIARFLNTMKIPTKQRGKGWHNYTVAEILKQEGVYVEIRRERNGLHQHQPARQTIAKHTRHVLTMFR